jgi:uncharacterized membrane protein
VTTHVRWLLSRLNANYWFYPALFSIIGGALAFWLVWLDRNGFGEFLNSVEAIVPARPQSASNMLQIIAASTIAVASTVFSITIAAVAYASGTYGPRLLTNFMEDKGNQLSLATFIGTFVYSITVLRTVRAEDEVAANAANAADTALPGFVPQLSLLTAYLLMVVSVAVLVYFLNHIPSSIRINTVLHRIARRLLWGIEEAYPDEHTGVEPASGPDDGRAVPVAGRGYVQIIDFEGLCALARKHDCTLTLQVRTGDFLHPGMVFASIAGVSGPLPDLSDCYTLGASRTPEQDPQFLIDELVEIGLRALSPGINDPFTAITALHWLGAATADLGRRDLLKMKAWGETKRGDPQRVFPLPDDFSHYVMRGFGAMRSAVATSHTAALVMFDTLRHAAEAIDGRPTPRAIGPAGRSADRADSHQARGAGSGRARNTVRQLLRGDGAARPRAITRAAATNAMPKMSGQPSTSSKASQPVRAAMAGWVSSAMPTMSGLKLLSA